MCCAETGVLKLRAHRTFFVVFLQLCTEFLTFSPFSPPSLLLLSYCSSIGKSLGGQYYYSSPSLLSPPPTLSPFFLPLPPHCVLNSKACMASQSCIKRQSVDQSGEPEFLFKLHVSRVLCSKDFFFSLSSPHIRVSRLSLIQCSGLAKHRWT